MKPLFWILVGVAAVPLGYLGWQKYQDYQAGREQAVMDKMVVDAIAITERSKVYRDWTQPIRDAASRDGVDFHQEQEKFAEIGFKSFKLVPIDCEDDSHLCEVVGPWLAVFPKINQVFLGAVTQAPVVPNEKPQDSINPDWRIMVDLDKGAAYYSRMPVYQGAEWHWKSMESE